MSISSEITRLNNAKAAIKQSLANKGVEVSDSALLDEYPALIDSVEVGGGGEGGNLAYEAYWNLKTTNNTNYKEAFSDYKGTELDVSKLDTSNVTNMMYMFNNCSNLTSIGNVSNWDTSKVTTMSDMFYNCNKLTSLDVSNWDTGKVEYMYNMFRNCSTLTTLDLSNFNTTNVTNMGYMFFGCTRLQILDLSNFDASNVNNDYGMVSMLASCNSLHTLRLDNCNRTTINRIINSLPTGNIGVSRIIYCDEANATELKAPTGWRFSFEPEEKPYKFTDNADITEVTGDTVTITSEHIDLSEMFSNCYNLYSVDTNNWYTGNVTNMERMFYGCSSLTTIDGISNWDTSYVTSMSNMFDGCGSLYSLDLSNWHTSSVNYMANMFANCGLNELNISNFDTSNVWDNANDMFYGCSNLAYLHLDYCSYETVEKIINSSNFPVDNSGVIYCSYDVSSQLTPPGNWTFEAV